MSNTGVATADSPHLVSAVKKATKRILPMLIILYIVAFLDRTNVGFAQAGLEADRGISEGAYALGAGIFFIGYAVFEVPSNLALDKWGAKFWLARIAVSWGIVSSLFAFVWNETSFIVLRFLLGVTEAGLFPGVILFLAAWFPNQYRVQVMSLFYLGLPISQVFGSPLSGGLINLGEALGWVAGWQLMFFVEGMMAVVAGIFAFIFLVDSPQKAKFLTDDEKAALAHASEVEDALKKDDSPVGIWRAMASPRIWYFTAIYFCLQVAVYGVTFYLPQQVASLTGQSVGWEVGFLVAIPWFVGAFGLYYFGRYAKTVLRRRRLGVLFYVTTALCIIGSAWAGTNNQPVVGMIFITLAVLSFMSVSPITWSYPTAFLVSGATAATGIALINSIGNLGGFLAPILRTNVSAAAGDDPAAGIYAIAIFPLIAAVLLFGTRFFRQKADQMLVPDAKS